MTNEEEIVLICALVERLDEPVLGSVVGKCQRCKEDVWMSPKMIEFRKQHMTTSVIRCMACAYGEFDLGEQPMRAVPGTDPYEQKIADAVTKHMKALRQAGFEKWPD